MTPALFDPGPLYDHLPVGVLLADRDDRVVYVNRAFCLVAGRAPDEVTALTLPQAAALLSLTLTPQNMPALFAGDAGWQHPEKRLLGKDGSPRFVRLGTSAVTLPDGRSCRQLLVEDVTRYRAFADTLRDRHGLYHSLVEKRPDPVCRFLPVGSLLFANASFCRLFGKKRRSLVGRDLLSLFSLDNRDSLAAAINAVTAESPMAEVEQQLGFIKDRPLWVRWTIQGFFYRTGHVKHYQAVGLDISEQKIAEDRFIHASRLVSLGTLVSGVAHEISIIDRSWQHHYQPGWLFVPFGIYSLNDCIKPQADFIPSGIDFIQDEITNIDPVKKVVACKNGNHAYDWIVIATGCRIVPEEIEGMMDGWGDDILTFYNPTGAVALAKKLKHFNKGKLILNIAEMPIKCPVAPLEFVFMADWFFMNQDTRSNIEIELVTPLTGAFTKPVAAEILGRMCEEKNIKIVPNFEIGQVNVDKKTIESHRGEELPYDLLVSIPPNFGSQVIIDSDIGDPMGYMDTDNHTLKSKKYENMYIIGDATNVPTSKAGSVAHFESEIVVENILREIEDLPPLPDFDGHSNGFIVEERILSRLESIEAELQEARVARLERQELSHDASPLMKSAFKILLKELGSVEAGFQLEDLFLLLKRFIRNIGNLAFALDQLENGIELWKTFEPLLKSMVHAGIRNLGELEQRGVFRTYAAMLEIRAKVAEQYGPEDIQAMGDNFVALIGLLKKMVTPELLDLLDKVAEMPASLDLAAVKPVGPLGLVSAIRDPELKKGLGVALQLGKALGRLADGEPR